VGTATGAKVKSVKQPNENYRKPNVNVESAADLRAERWAFSQRSNPHVRRRYDPQQAIVRSLTRSDRASLSRCDRNIRRRAARLRAAELLVANARDGWRSNRHVPMLDRGPQFEVAVTSAHLRDGTLEPHQNTVKAEATTPTSDMVAPLLAVAASSEQGAVP
jgi:hypothetical protein